MAQKSPPSQSCPSASKGSLLGFVGVLPTGLGGGIFGRERANTYYIAFLAKM